MRREHTPQPIRANVPTTTGTGLEVPAQLCWTQQLPCEVRIELFDRRAGVWRPWRISRDLLSDGLTRPAGDGDVRVEPFPHIPGIPGDVLLALGHPWSTPRTALFLLHGPTVSGFLADTHRQIPPGREHITIPDPRWFTQEGGGHA